MGRTALNLDALANLPPETPLTSRGPKPPLMLLNKTIFVHYFVPFDSIAARLIVNVLMRSFVPGIEIGLEIDI